MTTSHTPQKPQDTTEAFIRDYARALLDRDSARLGSLYAVPALIAVPGQSLPVTSREQTQQFFDQGWEQYADVDEAVPTVAVIAATAHSIWADVTWSYGGPPRERFVYQLLDVDGAWQVGVLTPLGPDD